MAIKQSRSIAVTMVAMAAVLTAASMADAHGMAGKRFFPATLAIDDPFVADELSLPTFSILKQPGEEGAPPFRETVISAELQKRLTPNLGLNLGGAFVIQDPDGGTSVSGFDDLELGLKYQFFTSAEHEMLLSLGVNFDVGGTGSGKIGAESFTITPTLFFGKGLGDLPDAAWWLQPLAVTGLFGVSVPTKSQTATQEVTEEGILEINQTPNAKAAVWGVTLQYNLQYLQSYVRDIGLPRPFSRMIPIVEFAMSTPLEGKDAGRTVGTISPGLIWFGRYVQLGLEMLIPANSRSGKNVGVLGQVHFYLDDILPKVFTWTPSHGVLGPAVPQ